MKNKGKRSKTVIVKPYSPIMWVNDKNSLDKMISYIKTLSGPIAVDSERACGIRYDSDKAYLIQMKRENTIFLIDPIKTGNLKDLNEAIKNSEWVLHAADQDIPCLVKQGLIPTKIFDTEKSSRLLNYSKVSLGKMIEEKLNITLEKLHSNENWSMRPIPQKWLDYAALDVEYLIDLRDILYKELEETHKLEYALEEFEYCLDTTYPKFLERQKEKQNLQNIFHFVPGAYALSPRELAVVKELYLSRESLAKKLDTAPSSLLSTKALVQAAKTMPKSREEMVKLSLFKGAKNRPHKNRWWGAIARAKNYPEDKLPVYKAKEHKDIYPNTAWIKTYPNKYERLQIIKEISANIAEQVNTRVENIITTRDKNIIAWNLSDFPSLEEIDDVFSLCSLRNWQKNLLRNNIYKAFK